MAFYDVLDVSESLLPLRAERLVPGGSGPAPVDPDPTLTWSTAPYSTVEWDGQIDLEVDGVGVVSLVLVARIPGGPHELIFSGGVFSPGYTTSTYFESGTVKSFSLARGGEGWRDGTVVYVAAVGSQGQAVSWTGLFYANEKPPEPGPDPVDPPKLTWISPAPGTPIEPNDSLSLKVTSPDLAYLGLQALFPDQGDFDVVFEDSSFSVKYSGSQYERDGDDHLFTIRRRGGWPSRVRIRAIAVDSSGRRGTT